MILKIDTTDTSKIKVELINTKSNIKDQLSTKQVSAQILLPTVIEILKRNKKDFKDVREIKVNIGPGSFTGTRVGVAVANALGFALGIPVNGKKGKIVLPVYQKSKFDL